jgi:Na+/proline symporter
VSHHQSEWVEEDVLKEYNHKRKDKQMQLSYHKFISYITSIMSAITGQVPPELLTLKLTYLQFLASLKETAFIKDTYEPAPTDMVTELWNELSTNGQTVGVFIIFASAILNMKRSDEDNNQKYQYMWKKYS